MSAYANTTQTIRAVMGKAGLYGAPPPQVVDFPVDAIQFSPLEPGASPLELQSEGTLSSMTMLAPPGTLERRYAMALAISAVAPGSNFTALAPNNQGGTRLRKELQAFGCTVDEAARRHHRIVFCRRPMNVTGVEEALLDSGPQLVADLGLWSQPGVFSWDRIDPGTALLLRHLPALGGRGADFGSGIGILSRAVLESAMVEQITLIDIDRRAIDASKRNLDDARARFLWSDVRARNLGLGELDFVVMNAPFHDAGAEDRTLPTSFVNRAVEVLRTGGVCWLTANRHLPYEAVMKPLFKQIDLTIETGGYKIYEAHK